VPERLVLLLLGLLLLVLTTTPVWAQSSYDRYGGARSSALGYAATALAGDAGSHMNPALRALHEQPVAVVFVRQSFGLSPLRYGTAHLAVPLRGFVASGGAGTFGFSDYRELHLNLGAARSVRLGTTRALHLGVNLRYHHLRIPGFGRGGALAGNVGIAAEVLPTLMLGAHATNLLGAALAPTVPVPQTLAVGLGYLASRNVRVLADVVKDLDAPVSLRTGLEVVLVELLALRAGAATQPRRWTAGTGVELGALSADLAAERHPELGWSPSAALSIRW